MKKTLSVNKNYLVLIAGLVWVLAGGLVMRTGLPLFVELTPAYHWVPVLATIVFLGFYFPIFSKTVQKHVARIRDYPAPVMPVWLFFDLPSYIIMLVMITAGVLLRTGKLVPDWCVAFFYSGLGLALFACGTRFLYAFRRKRVLRGGPPAREEGEAGDWKAETGAGAGAHMGRGNFIGKAK